MQRKNKIDFSTLTYKRSITLLSMTLFKTIFKNKLISDIICHQLKFADLISLYDTLNPNNTCIDLLNNFAIHQNNTCEHLSDTSNCFECGKQICDEECLSLYCRVCGHYYCNICKDPEEVSVCSECWCEHCDECMTTCTKCNKKQCSDAETFMICTHIDYTCTKCNILQICKSALECQNCKKQFCEKCLNIPYFDKSKRRVCEICIDL